VIVPPTEYGDWLSCQSVDEARPFLQLYPVEAMHAEPFPLPAAQAKNGGNRAGSTAAVVTDARG